MTQTNKPESINPEITVAIATTAAEKEAIYQFRYQIYAEEMDRKLPSIDHNNKVIIDELDEWGWLLYAKVGSKIIGTVRVNIGPISKFPTDLAQLLYLEKFQKSTTKNALQNFSYTSKLMVAEPYRNSAALYLLSTKSYELYCHYQVQFNFGTCKIHLISLYEQFGSRRFRNNFIGPGYDGVMVPVVVLVDDIEHLRTVHSPFYRLARKRKVVSNEITEWFYAEFPEHSNFINSQLVSPEDLWSFLYKCLRRKPNQAIPILQGLSETEAKRFLHCCGNIVKCQPGDHITICGDVSYSLGILLTGKLKSSIHNALIALRGQCFGEIGLVNHPLYTENIFAGTTADIMIISSLNFQRFQHAHPEITAKIIENMSALTRNSSNSYTISHQQPPQKRVL